MTDEPKKKRPQPTGERLRRKREQTKQWHRDHPEKRREYARRVREKNKRLGIDPGLPARKRWVHGTDYAAMFAELWDAQDGKCYLCGDPLVPGPKTHVDHDHTCCGYKRTCAYCRRGLACDRCNHVLGHVEDDPERLRRIADNLEPVLKATRARIATKAQQDSLWEDAS